MSSHSISQIRYSVELGFSGGTSSRSYCSMCTWNGPHCSMCTWRGRTWAGRTWRRPTWKGLSWWGAPGKGNRPDGRTTRQCAKSRPQRDPERSKYSGRPAPGVLSVHKGIAGPSDDDSVAGRRLQGWGRMRRSESSCSGRKGEHRGSRAWRLSRDDGEQLAGPDRGAERRAVAGGPSRGSPRRWSRRTRTIHRRIAEG